MPAVLIECGFLSNPEEAKLLGSYEYQKKLAFVTYLSLAEFLNNGELQ
jgi:N-acetylmuramoyl-L-alanine amidase